MKDVLQLTPFQLIPNNWSHILRRFLLAFILLGSIILVVSAQSDNTPKPKYTIPENALIIENTVESDVFGFGKTVVIRGNVTQGVIALGGDVIVEGKVEGDVATIGGSIFQTQNSYIGGDVIVLGGTYHHGKGSPVRNPEKATVMYAGYEEELRGLMQNPTTLFSPSVSPAYLAQRLLALLFWFLISLFLITIAPGAVSRAVTRLHLKTLYLAAIGISALLVATFGIVGGLSFLPTEISAIVGLATTILFLLAYTFGRVALQAATGNILLKKFYGEGKHSESVALFVGTFFWTFILSLPYIWTIAFGVLITYSFGLVLTARQK